jgi:predicted alpha/beta-fold hydrolase
MEANQFIPIPFLKNAHVMTVAAAVWPRQFKISESSGERRLFQVEPESKVLTHCHWQTDRTDRPTLLILHGMEGSSSSHYVLGLTQKALSYGFNVVRMNMRNCGGTTDLTPTLYNGGMSPDVLAVVRELKDKDKLGRVLLSGCSLGGNIVLKCAAELGAEGPALIAGVCAVSPSIDLALSVACLEQGFNRLYQWRFLQGLKIKLKDKNKQFPQLYDFRPLDYIKSIKEFDDTYTAPLAGYGTADNYYRLCSSSPMLTNIRVPTLIVHAQDDPLVPFASFAQLDNQLITLLAPEHGGHGGFIHHNHEEPPLLDRFWAENRVVKFCAGIALSELSRFGPTTR